MKFLVDQLLIIDFYTKLHYDSASKKIYLHML